MNRNTIVGAGGEYSDFQEIQKYLRDLTYYLFVCVELSQHCTYWCIRVEDFEQDDGVHYTPSVFKLRVRFLVSHSFSCLASIFVFVASAL